MISRRQSQLQSHCVWTSNMKPSTLRQITQHRAHCSSPLRVNALVCMHSFLWCVTHKQPLRGLSVARFCSRFAKQVAELTPGKSIRHWVTLNAAAFYFYGPTKDLQLWQSLLRLRVAASCMIKGCHRELRAARRCLQAADSNCIFIKMACIMYQTCELKRSHTGRMTQSNNTWQVHSGWSLPDLFGLWLFKAASFISSPPFLISQPVRFSSNPLKFSQTSRGDTVSRHIRLLLSARNKLNWISLMYRMLKTH